MRLLGRLLADLRGLLVIQGSLLAITVVMTGSDVGDVRVQLAWLLFPVGC